MSRHEWSDRMNEAGATRGRFALAGALALMAAGLAGCSAVPSWANPFGESRAASSPSESQGFPELSSVPGEKPQATSPAEQKEIASGLAADRAEAKHTDEVLRGGTEPPAPAPQVSAPTTPVAPLKDTPDDTDLKNGKRSYNDAPKVIPMPGRGGHKTLAAAKGVQTAQADTDTGKAAAPVPAEDKPNPDAEQPVNAAPTTPVEVKPADAQKANL